MHYPELMVLTPRGGIYNHRYVVTATSGLDAAGCGRIYREVKGAVGESSVGCGRLEGPGGSSFAAASHVVAQQESAGRRGAEWLIVVDPRIGGLDAAAQARLTRDLEERLARLGQDVLERIPWNDHGGTEVISDDALTAWSREIKLHFAGARVPRAAGDERGARPGSEPTGPGGSLAKRAAIMAAIILALFVLWQSGNALFEKMFVKPGGQPGQQQQQQQQNQLLARASVALGLGASTDDRGVAERLAGLFLDVENARKKPATDLLRTLYQTAMGAQVGGVELVNDGGFWKAVADACPLNTALRNTRAFLSPEDARAVGDLADPKLLHTLARVVRDLRELDTAEAKPDDAKLVPLFQSLIRESEAISRAGVEQTLRVFTKDDAALARSLIEAFEDQGVRDAIEKRYRVEDTASLASWMRAMGMPRSKGLFSDAYFQQLRDAEQEIGSKPKQRCLALLQEFCATCTKSLPGVGTRAQALRSQPNAMPSGVK